MQICAKKSAHTAATVQTQMHSEYQYNTNMDLKGKVLKTTGKAIDAGYKSASQEIKKGYNAIKKDYEETEIKER